MTMAERSAADVRYGRLILGGVAAGAVVFGPGSRVAMRVVGIMASPQHLGEPTASDAVLNLAERSLESGPDLSSPRRRHARG